MSARCYLVAVALWGCGTLVGGFWHYMSSSKQGEPLYVYFESIVFPFSENTFGGLTSISSGADFSSAKAPTSEVLTRALIETLFSDPKYSDKLFVVESIDQAHLVIEGELLLDNTLRMTVRNRQNELDYVREFPFQEDQLLSLQDEILQFVFQVQKTIGS